MKLARIEAPGYKPNYRAVKNAAAEAQRWANETRQPHTVTYPDGTKKTFTPADTFAAVVRDFRSRYLGQPQRNRADWMDLEMILDCAVDDGEINDAQRDALRAHFAANPGELE